MRPKILFVLSCFMITGYAARAELPPVPVPAENPVTEPKRILGKILFWDEQLSSDDTVACGTCHRPSAGGADPRSGTFPGALPGSFDDVAGSPGIRRYDTDGSPVPDPVFGDRPQVTRRTAPSVFGALWASELFWDGRAGGRLVDPATGRVVIESGAALENQVLITLASDVEMTRPGRSWGELELKLGAVEPLALADHWPTDVRRAIDAAPSYPELFANAFGDEAISAARIAMAIASYERTLVADQTPFDRFRAGDAAALTDRARPGWAAFQSLRCSDCHRPPLFSSNDFANIGLRRSEYDNGRGDVSGSVEDDGAMKIPSLRNVGLRPRLTHTGEFRSLSETIAFYVNPGNFPEVDELPDGGAYSFSMSQLTMADIRVFLTEALTDPRVASELPPFDRPRLASERAPP